MSNTNWPHQNNTNFLSDINEKFNEYKSKKKLGLESLSYSFTSSTNGCSSSNLNIHPVPK